MDEVFWDNWDKTVLKHFQDLIPQKEIYGSLNSYYRYQLQKKQYKKAFGIAGKIIRNTKSPGFGWLALKQFIQSINKHAG
jgi:hypothetical protein